MIHHTCRISAFVFLSFVFFQSACSGRDSIPQESPRVHTVDGGIVALANSCVVVVSDNKVIAWEPNGESRWRLDLPDGDRAVAPPAAAPNSVVYIRGAQSIYAVSPEGKILWQAKYADDSAQIKNILALSDSSAALVTGDTTVVCYATSGEVRWIYTLPDGDRLITAPAAAPNGLLHLRGRNRLYAVNAEGKWQWQVDAQ